MSATTATGRTRPSRHTASAVLAALDALESRRLFSSAAVTSGGLLAAAEVSPTAVARVSLAAPINSLAAKPSPKIAAMRSTVMAGEAVFVDGLASSYGGGSQDTSHFEWNFGDASGSYNSNLVGFNAGHIYDKAGTYTVTLKLTNDSGGVATATTKVTVTNASRSAIYVSSSGSDGSSGSSSGSPVKTWARAMALAGKRDNVDILFKGGDTISVTKEFTVTGDNVRIASYGSGKAILKYTGPRQRFDMVRVNAGALGTVIENVTFDSIYMGPDASRTGMPHAISLIGSQTAVRRVTFLNLGYDINCNNQPKGVMVQDCQSPTKYGLRSYLVWAQGTDFVVIGNLVANSTNEHPIRVFGVDRMLIAYNDLSNRQEYSFETSKTALNIQKGNDVTVYGNHLRGPRMQIGPLGGADGINDKGARLKDVVVENNQFDDTTIQMYTGLEHVFLRDNTFDYTNIDAIEIEGYSSTYGRGIVDVNITDNSFSNDGTQGGVVDVEGSVNGIKLEDNVYRATHLVMGSKGTAAVYAVSMSAFNSFTTIDGNTWSIPASYPSWLSSHTTGKVFALIGQDQANTGNYYNIDRWNALSKVGTDVQKNV